MSDVAIQQPGNFGPLETALCPARRLWTETWPILLVGGLLRLILSLVILGSSPLYNDAEDYFQEASRIAAGMSEGRPFYWPPGTTFYLAFLFRLFGESVAAARVGTALLGVLEIALIVQITLDLTRNSRIARMAGWIGALYPPAVFLSFQPYSQHLATLCLTGAALFGYRTFKNCRWQPAVLTGLFLGLGCLTRPSMGSVAALFPVGATVYVWHLARCRQDYHLRRLATLTALGCLVCFLVMAPVFIYNGLAGAGLTISTNNQRNFFLGNNPYTPHYKTSHLAQHSLSELPLEVQDYLQSYYSRPDARQAMMKGAVEYIQTHPAITLLRVTNRMRAFLGFDYLAALAIRQTQHLSGPLFALLLLLEAGGYFLVMILAIATQTTRWKLLEGRCAVWLLAVVSAYAAPYLIAFSAGTYHFPVMGLIVPFAAV